MECTIQVRSGGEWKTVASDTLGADTSIVYFTNDDGKYIAVYETDAVKLVLKTANGSQVSIAELDVLGPTGDNVEFRKAGEGTVAIGRLTADYMRKDRRFRRIPLSSQEATKEALPIMC